MGCCCIKPKIEDQGDEVQKIIKKYRIDKVEELSNACLKYGGERCSQKWYTASVYSDTKDDKQEMENHVVACREREIYFLSKLSHMNIVKFIGVHFKQNYPQQPILVTEEVTSNLMYHLDKVKTLEESEKFKFSCGMSEGMAYLHSLRIAHLNLSTKSIFLTDNLTVKITNFEYAMYFLKADDNEASSSSSVPPGGKSHDPWKFRDDQSVFKFLPQKYLKRAYDSSDIYSFGCVVFNIFTLKQPPQQVASHTTEISVPGVQCLVNDCLWGKLDSMQEVNETLKNICSKESSNSIKEQAQDVCKAEVHHELIRSESGQDINTLSAASSLQVESHVQTEDAMIPQENLETYDQSGRMSNASKPDEKNESDLTQRELKQKLEEITVTNDIQKAKLIKVNKKVEELTAKNEELETQNRSLKEKTEELKECTEEFESKQKVLTSQDEKLKNEIKGLEQAVHNKELELAEAKKQYELLESTTTQQTEHLTRSPEVLNAQMGEEPKRDSEESLQKQVDKLQMENSILVSMLTKMEEQSFSFTNAFTTAGEGSVIKLRDTYRNLQANTRPAANRAHKKVYKGIELPIAEHTMTAYEEAKKLALQEFKTVSEQLKSLFQLQTTKKDDSELQHQKAMKQKGQQLLESFHIKSLNEKIYQVLIDKYKALTSQAPAGIPKAVDDYYSSIAKLAWDCVARTIPMIMSTDETKFDGDMHETGDGDTEDDNENFKGKDITYVYPVLLTSNSWPREIALKGKVKISADSINRSSKDIASEGKIKPFQDIDNNDVI